MEREEILRQVFTLAEGEISSGKALIGPDELRVVEQIAEQLAQRWDRIPGEFAESMISVCVALLCGGRRGRRVTDREISAVERRVRH